MPHDESPPVLLTYANPQSGTQRLLFRLDVVIVGLWVASALAFLAVAGKEFAYHVSSRSWTTMWESAPLQVALHAPRGEPIYGDWYQGPVHLAIYGPLYYRVLGWLAIGVHGDAQALIPVARWWSIFCLAGGLVGVAWFIRGARAPGWAALIGLSCIGLLTGTAIRFIASARPDAMAVGLSCLGLAAALGRRRALLILGAILLSLAWLTKVTSVAAALAVLVTLFWRRDWRAFAWFFVTYAFINVGALVVLGFTTDGWFFKHMSVASAAPASVKYAWFMLSHRRYEQQLHYLFAFPALAVLTLALARARGRSSAVAQNPPGEPGPTHLQIAMLFFVASTVIALATAMRQGSDRNYLIEPTLAAGMVMGTWAAHVASWRDKQAWMWTRAAACFALFSPMLLNLPDRLHASRDSDRQQRDALSPYQDEALTWVHGLPQPLLCLDSWLAYRGGAFNDINDPIAYGSYTLSGGRDPISERIRRQYYACIVTLAPIEDPGNGLYGDIGSNWPSLRQAMLDNYQVVEGHGWCAYTPRNAAVTSRPESKP